MLIIAILGHLAVGAFVQSSSAFAYVHMFGVAIAGLAWVCFSHGRPERAAYVAAYFASCEVLWRMTNVSIFWEFGKYGCAAAMIITLFKLSHVKPHLPSTIYFLLLLPSAVITFWTLGFTIGRHPLSFNLSGPFALMVAVWYFSNVKLKGEQLRLVFICFICGSMATAGATLFSTLSAKVLRFSNNSNLDTSGGFGPNQVSAILGLGMLLVVFYLIQGRTPRLLRAILFTSAVLLAIESAMTFSRGGLVDALLTFLAASFVLLRYPAYRARIMPVIIAAVVAIVIALPQLETLTGGALGKRFENTSTTHRDQIVGAELGLFEQNPIFGIGVGLARDARHAAGKGVSGVAHTEFTRALAEHGLFGLAGIVLLIAMPLNKLRMTKEPIERASIVWCCCWTFLFMTFNALRLAAPSLIYGLAFVNLANPRVLFRMRTVPAVVPTSRSATAGAGY
jgi:O-antigen ligase